MSSVRLHNTLHPKTLHPKHRRRHSVPAAPIRELDRHAKMLLWACVCIAFAIVLANIR